MNYKEWVNPKIYSSVTLGNKSITTDEYNKIVTLLIKTIMPVIACAFFKNNVQRCKVFSIRGIAGAVVTLLFMTAGYVFFGGILYGSAAAGIASAPGLLLKSVVNLAVYLFVAFGISKVKKFN